MSLQVKDFVLRLAEPERAMKNDPVFTPISVSVEIGGAVENRSSECAPVWWALLPDDSKSKRYRYWYGSCGFCAVAIIVAVCSVLLLARSSSTNSQSMRNRASITLTLDVPATSMSSSLGAGIKCDVAGSLQGVQPSINFDDIYLNSFALITQAEEVQVSSLDVSRQ